MAILKDLVVQGSSRFLNKAYFNDLQISGAATFVSLSLSGNLSVSGTATVTGNITTNGNLYALTGNIYLQNNRLAMYGISGDTWLRINPSGAFTSGVYFDSSVVRTDGTLQVGSSGAYLKSNSSNTTIANLVSPIAAISTINADNVSVTNNLHATHFDLQTVAQLGGSFYVSPTVKFPNSGTTLGVAKSGTTLTLTIIDDSISSSMAGIAWSVGSAVKVSGTINGVVTGTMDGTITDQTNFGSHKLVLSVSGENSGSVVASPTNTPYTSSQFSDLSVMVYQRRQDNNDYRVGIWMNCYDLTNSSATIRVYGGTSSAPNVLLGNLTNAGLGTVNNIAPSGWGLYAQNAFLWGAIVSTEGQIGGWTIGDTSLTNGTLGSSGMHLFTANVNTGVNFAGAGSALKTWRLGIGSNFGVVSDGKLYCTSAQIGPWTLSSTAIYKANATMGSSTSGAAYFGNDGLSVTDKFKVTSAGALTATSATVTGAITATSGTIGGITANSSYGLYTNSKTSATSTNTGFLISKDGAIYLGAYNSTNGACPFQVTAAGALTATSGKIGCWNIGATSFYSDGHAAYNTNANGIYMDATYLAGGKQAAWYFKNDGSAKIGAMTLSSAGVLSVPAANITGTLSVGVNNVTGLNELLDEKASASALNTLSNKVTAIQGTCSASYQSARDKVVDCSGFDFYDGALIAVTFSSSNTYYSNNNNTASLRLNVNGTGLRDVWVDSAATSNTNQLLWAQGAIITFRYSGNANSGKYIVVGEPRSWYGASDIAAGDSVKTDNVTSITGCVVCKGTSVSLSMRYENTADYPKLNISGTGEINLYSGNDQSYRPKASNGRSWTNESTASFVFDGRYWRIAETSGLSKAYIANTNAVSALTNANTAATKATSYITDITSDGVFVHEKSSSDVTPTTSGVNGVHISSDVKIIRNAQVVATYGSSIILGKLASGVAHVEIDSDSFDVCLGATTGTNSTKLATFGSTATIGDMSSRGVSIDSNGFKFNNGGTQNFFIGVDSRQTQISNTGSGSVTNSSATVTVNGTKYYRAAQVQSSWNITIVNGTLTAAADLNGDEMMFEQAENPVKSFVVQSNYLYVYDGFDNYSTFSESISFNYTTLGTTNNPYMILGTSAYSSQAVAGSMSFAQGKSCIASGIYSFASGDTCVASGVCSSSGGFKSESTGDVSFSHGIESVASNLSSIAIGYNAISSGPYSAAIGFKPVSSGSHSMAFGSENKASGMGALAMGNYTTASGAYSTAIGYHTTASLGYNTAVGYYTYANRFAQFVTGTYNILDTTPSTAVHSSGVNFGNYAFIIGNGYNESHRSNALTVDWKGNVTASGHVYSQIADWSNLNFGNSVASSGSVWAHRCGKIVWVHGFHYLTGTSGNIVTLPWKPLEDISIPVQADASGAYLCGYMDLVISNNSAILKTGTTMIGYNRYSFTYMTNDT